MNAPTVDFREDPLFQRIGDHQRAALEYGYAVDRSDAEDRGHASDHATAYSAGENLAAADTTMLLHAALSRLTSEQVDAVFRSVPRREIPDYIGEAMRFVWPQLEGEVRHGAANRFVLQEIARRQRRHA